MMTERGWYSGRASAFQAEDAGSTPAPRSPDDEALPPLSADDRAFLLALGFEPVGRA